jgi:pteridine reductase
MSKAALHAMVEALALELAPAVRVNAVLPGVVAWPDDAPAEERAAYESRIPLARPGTPEDAARMVRTVIEDMPYVTGSLLRLDGGRWLR